MHNALGEGVFYSIQEAKAVNPDSVTHLQLGNNDLTAFPVEVFQFKNLNFLSFIDSNIGEIYATTPWILSESERLEAIEKTSKFGSNLRVYPEGIHGFPTYHKNKIGGVPDEIAQLKNLNVLMFEKYQVSKREYKRLKKMLSNCTVERF